jgi:hypothetical protein
MRRAAFVFNSRGADRGPNMMRSAAYDVGIPRIVMKKISPVHRELN